MGHAASVALAAAVIFIPNSLEASLSSYVPPPQSELGCMKTGIVNYARETLIKSNRGQIFGLSLDFVIEEHNVKRRYVLEFVYPHLSLEKPNRLAEYYGILSLAPGNGIAFDCRSFNELNGGAGDKWIRRR